ncbi:MAG: LTA synthase family protein [Planctomycetes bacterium]|nr:LTA synthase family protein [Planctomycetota bacterium]
MTPPTKTPPSRCWSAKLGPLAYLGGLALGSLLVLSLGRLLLVLAFHARAALEPRYGLVFPLGLRIDLATVGYALALPMLFVLLAPAALLRRARRALALYFALVLTVLVALEAISFDFIEQYDARPNRLFIEYLGSREVFATLWAQYRVNLLLVALAIVVCLYGGARLGARLARDSASWSAVRRGVALLACAPLLFLGIRGTLQHRPINAAMVAFSGQNIVNQLALNSSYTVARAWYDVRHERSPAELYGKMQEEEVFARVGRYLDSAPTERLTGDVPFLRRQGSRASGARPKNLVIVLEESLGAEFVGCLGGKALTPCLDALTKEGLLLTKLFCTGTRTVRGIEAVVSGFLPTPGDSVVKLSRSQADFFTLAALLKQHGYATDFVYGGESHFDNMAAFFLANGFERCFNEDDYAQPAFRGTWGVSDEDLMQKANEVFVAHGEQPFFALVLSTTNHSPYEFPDGRIELHDAEKATRNNTVKYADYAIGQLFERAKKERYYADTLFLVVADHDERTYGPDLIPVDKFHIPGLFIGALVAPGTTYERVASQIDLAPTALGLLGLETVHPMIGRDLLNLSPDIPGRAILQFNDNHGFLVDDRLVVHPGGAPPRSFRVVDWRLQPRDDDPELVRDALAHALLPGILYESGRYRLPAVAK